MDLDELKAVLAERVSLYYDRIIDKEYPAINRTTILLGIDPTEEDMRRFFTEKLAERDDLLTQVDNLGTKEILEEFYRSNDDDVMTSIIRTYFSGASESQQYALLDALYPLCD